MKNLTQTTTYHDENKTIIKKIYFEDEQGLKQGSFKRFYASGNIEAEANYKDGKLDGAYKHYYENGNIIMECTYKDRKLEGVFKKYNRDGSLIEAKTF